MRLPASRLRLRCGNCSGLGSKRSWLTNWGVRDAVPFQRVAFGRLRESVLSSAVRQGGANTVLTAR